MLNWIGSAVTSDIGKVVIGALIALGIAWANTWFGIWRDRKTEERKRSRTEKHAAALLCSTLDLFINECLDGAIDNGVLDANLHLAPRTPYPTLSYQKEVDWTCIEDDIMYGALRLVGEVDSGRRAVDWEALAAEPPVKTSFFEERIIRISEAGLRASMLLEQVKARYNISTQDRSNVDLVQIFGQTLAKIEQHRNSRKEVEARHRIAEALVQGGPVPQSHSEATRSVIEALLQQAKPRVQQ